MAAPTDVCRVRHHPLPEHLPLQARLPGRCFFRQADSRQVGFPQAQDWFPGFGFLQWILGDCFMRVLLSTEGHPHFQNPHFQQVRAFLRDFLLRVHFGHLPDRCLWIR